MANPPYLNMANTEQPKWSNIEKKNYFIFWTQSIDFHTYFPNELTGW